MQQRRPRELRIIAGEWRGRKLRFPAQTSIRPTPDRVRETLFNWIGPRIRGVHALDLFAGSGVLGLEALSRGAAAVTFVDSDPRAVQALRERLVEWGAQGGTVVRAEAQAFVAAGVRRVAEAGGAAEKIGAGGAAEITADAGRVVAGQFGLVFLDPPFAAGLLSPIAQALESGGWLAPGALLYVEAAAADRLPAWPADWELLRSGQAGAVGYHLLRRAGRHLGTGQPT
ncbi:MAG: 16S rRNA (guanine(966)-N(2))-methyltransferase RsmD [Steroidobacteraceae bacterium]|nr:16S rRNA (guanine(966)-N(2))-methyltransferase RsmD [Nevskiaceae bacterium]MCP5359469.1 16S rRNA (guanine(966)-N(2))-methyltransferase RsmD [Nevskiaceae bacterium]MCP5466811.1 16S rRNA (guanine(966)-N(2))-methyltransferase RsmD [Nevskiaceae bacterium]MCP5470900.1 16S rRNA (guanine(966)-N(2))-methyltransferase RsmD [Nevskiaceae bacterium]